ncbi:MAG: MltA domain-containing protein [SAR324 cluster bacterium]
MPDWHDDSTLASLQAAIAQSLAYYRTLPPDAPIPVGPLTYTATEMAQSLQLFLTLRLTSTDAAEFSRRLQRDFLVFESIAEQGANLFTGYYEPHIQGSLTPTAQFSAPLYARPDDLVEVSLDDFGKDLPRRKVVGRVQGGRLVPYYSREEIEQGGVLEGRAQPIAYVNEVDLFFLQIQGSGQVELPDGRTISVGYEASNGQPYRALGAEMIRRNLMTREDVSLFSLKRYLADHQNLVPGLLNSNPSYVFFHTRDDSRGPWGNLRVPLTAGRSLAADQLLLPPGALAYVMTTVPVPERLREEPAKPPERLREEPAKPPERLREEPAKPPERLREEPVLTVAPDGAAPLHQISSLAALGTGFPSPPLQGEKANETVERDAAHSETQAPLLHTVEKACAGCSQGGQGDEERMGDEPVKPSDRITGFRDVDRFMLIQDTGGAIRGHGRADLFWGEGPDAEWVAGRARNPGRLFILVARKEALPPPDAPARPVPHAPQPELLGRPLQARMP